MLLLYIMNSVELYSFRTQILSAWTNDPFNLVKYRALFFVVVVLWNKTFSFYQVENIYFRYTR